MNINKIILGITLLASICTIQAMEKNERKREYEDDQQNIFWPFDTDQELLLPEIPIDEIQSPYDYQPHEKYQKVQEADTSATTNAVIQEQPNFSTQLTEMRNLANTLSTVVVQNCSRIEKLEGIASELQSAVEEIKKSIAAQENTIQRLLAINNYKPTASTSPVPTALPKLIPKNPPSPILKKTCIQPVIYQPQNNGYTPLMTAVLSNDVQKVKDLLTEESINVNIKDVRKSATALHYAIDQVNPEIVDLLIKKGADVNVSIGTGATPLTLAIVKKNINIITLLLKEQANPNIKIKCKDGKGYCALELARWMEKKEPDTLKPIIDLLIKHGAR